MLYLNENQETFYEVSNKAVYSKAGYLSGYNTGTALADIDEDGDVDIVVGNLQYWSSLLRNTKNDSNYIILNIIGTKDTYEALGTKIWVYPSKKNFSMNSLIAFKEINLSNGLFSQNWNRVHIGLGNYDKVDIKIRYLNGQEIILKDILNGTSLKVYQENTTLRLVYKAARSFFQFIHIPFIGYEILKLIIFILVIFASVRFIEIRYNWKPAHLVIYALIVVIIYGALTLLLPRSSGAPYHAMPFGMIIFALLVLVSVNEQIRKSSIKRNLIQKRIQEVSANLSHIKIMDKAISLVFKTLKFIYPYRFSVMYTYYSTGNYFLYKKSDGIRIGKSSRKVIIERKKIRQLIRKKIPLSFPQFNSLWLNNKNFDDQTLMFPLIMGNDIQGVIILGLNYNHIEIEPHLLSAIDYLFLQLTTALNNIRMIQDIEDREKIMAIGTFSSGIIHNLKNPIDGLRMMIEVLNHEIKPENPQHEFIQELYKGVLKLKETLLHSFDIINYTDQSKEKISINPLIFEINEQFIKLNYPSMQLNFEQNVISVLGNHTQLRIAFENIIQNAMEASSYSEIVNVKTQLKKNEEIIQIDIIDKGPGIAIDEQDKIFDMFYSTRGEGRGLGLTITQNIIKNHDGYINVKSAPGEGTIFSVILPIS